MKKSEAYDDPCVVLLRKMSKAALVDCVVDLLRGISDNCDDPVPLSVASERLSPVMRMRGDRMPKMTTPSVQE